MKFFERVSSGMSNARSWFGKPFNRAFMSLSEVLHPAISGNDHFDQVTRQIVMLMKAIVIADGKVDDEEIAGIRRNFSERFTPGEIEELTKILKDTDPPDVDAAISSLQELPDREKAALCAGLIELAYANSHYTGEQKKIVHQVAREFDVPDGIIAGFEEESYQASAQRERILKSGAGIFAALVIIAIFILAATFLKSVLFGVIFAFIFLPLEKWFENKFFKNRMVAGIVSGIGKLTIPFRAVAERVAKFFRKGKEKPEPTEADIRTKELESRVTHATIATVVTLILVALLLVSGVSMLSASYVAVLGKKFKSWAEEHGKKEMAVKGKISPSATTADIKKSDAPVDNQKTQVDIADKDPEAKDLKEKASSSAWKMMKGKIESYRPQLEKVPGFKWALDKVTAYLKDDKNREELTGMLLSKSKGIFSATAGIAGFVGNFLFGLLMTVFFFSYFLQKMALASAIKREKAVSAGKHIVDGVFDSKWMPATSPEAREEAREILDNICAKLKTWLRGYFSIIFIESTYYIVMFTIIGVPYSAVLGLIAGFTVLLPFIGPLASITLTILVCFAAAPNASLVLILLVLITYGIMNGILEQLFLYPALIGGGLGLSTLETIIVVLLGGMFAGITGMIFAVPAAAILKYLIPKIYRCLAPEKPENSTVGTV